MGRWLVLFVIAASPGMVSADEYDGDISELIAMVNVMSRAVQGCEIEWQAYGGERDNCRLARKHKDRFRLMLKFYQGREGLMLERVEENGTMPEFFMHQMKSMMNSVNAIKLYRE